MPDLTNLKVSSPVIVPDHLDTTNVICLFPETVVNVIKDSNNNMHYVFNGDKTYDPNTKWGLSVATYTFKNIPQEHAMAIYADNTNIRIIGNDARMTEKNGVQYWWGDAEVKVLGDFGKANVLQVENEYMHGTDLLQYKSSCSISNIIDNDPDNEAEEATKQPEAKPDTKPDTKPEDKIFLGGNIRGYQPQLLGGGANSSSGSGMVGSNERGMSRTMLRKSFGRTNWLDAVTNKKNVNKSTPFRVAMNAGDINGTKNASPMKELKPPNQVNSVNALMGRLYGIGDGVKHGGAAYSGNPNYVYDSSDYIRYKKLGAKLKTYNTISFGGPPKSSNPFLMAMRK